MSIAADFAAVHDSYVRAQALRLLADLPEFRGNDMVIADAVRAVGLACSGEQMRQHLTWMAEQRLVTLTDLAGMTIATLTERGADVAAGRVSVPGVHRAGPRN